MNSNRKQPIAFATMIMVCFEHLGDSSLCHTAQDMTKLKG
jgi:hypothetical protein